MSLKQWLSPASTSTSAKRNTKKKPRSKAPAFGRQFEQLEDRTVPAFTGVVVGPTATLTGDAAGDTLTVSVIGGFLQHNLPTGPGTFN